MQPFMPIILVTIYLVTAKLLRLILLEVHLTATIIHQMLILWVSCANFKLCLQASSVLANIRAFKLEQHIAVRHFYFKTHCSGIIC